MNFVELDSTRMMKPAGATPVLEACLAAQVRRALVYPKNLTPGFFDLSSGEAGEILQKFRSWRLRVAVVCEPGSVRFSTHFPEIAGEVRDVFRIFDTAEDARQWLSE
ncbi:MAG TPA: DUF4180 domain-containing protein [Bryobacteraceae bacterium]|jgi:hypothetical protein|nr:DUF4180 domain-containing protein [Bryobacteraceae bacterium]